MSRRTPKRRKKTPSPKAKKRTPRKPAPRKKTPPKKPKRTPKKVSGRKYKPKGRGWRAVNIIDLKAAQRRAVWSAAHAKGWETRRRKQKLLIAMRAKGWREESLPTRDELLDYLQFLAKKFEIELSDMYRLYFGYEVGEAA